MTTEYSTFCLNQFRGGIILVRDEQWRRQDFVTGGSEVWVGGLEYEVPQKLTHLLQCIGNSQSLVRYDFNRLAVYLSFRTPIGGKLPPPLAAPLETKCSFYLFCCGLVWVAIQTRLSERRRCGSVNTSLEDVSIDSQLSGAGYDPLFNDDQQRQTRDRKSR